MPRKGEEGSSPPHADLGDLDLPEPGGGPWGSSFRPPPSPSWAPGFAATKHHGAGRLMPTDAYPPWAPEAGRLSAGAGGPGFSVTAPGRGPSCFLPVPVPGACRESLAALARVRRSNPHPRHPTPSFACISIPPLLRRTPAALGPGPACLQYHLLFAWGHWTRPYFQIRSRSQVLGLGFEHRTARNTTSVLTTRTLIFPAWPAPPGPPNVSSP